MSSLCSLIGQQSQSLALIGWIWHTRVSSTHFLWHSFGPQLVMSPVCSEHTVLITFVWTLVIIKPQCVPTRDCFIRHRVLSMHCMVSHITILNIYCHCNFHWKCAMDLCYDSVHISLYPDFLSSSSLRLCVESCQCVVNFLCSHWSDADNTGLWLADAGSGDHTGGTHHCSLVLSAPRICGDWVKIIRSEKIGAII